MRSFAFRRPTWHAVIMACTPVWFLVPMLFTPLVRVWIDAEAIVLARAGFGTREHGRVARADIVEIRRSAGDLVIVVRGAARESLSPSG